MKPVLAFLQNMWVRDPRRVEQLIERYGEAYRRKLIRYALFAGCLTGRRIQKAFEIDLIEQMEFEEVSREISGHPSFVPTADLRHIRQALKYYKPRVVITFGKIAEQALQGEWRGPMVVALHPAARDSAIEANLCLSARTLKRLLSQNR